MSLKGRVCDFSILNLSRFRFKYLLSSCDNFVIIDCIVLAFQSDMKGSSLLCIFGTGQDYGERRIEFKKKTENNFFRKTTLIEISM